MSRVEPKDHQPPRREAQSERRTTPSRTPGKAEGDEQTIEEALRHQEEQRKS